MSLFQATILTGLALAVSGGLFLWRGAGSAPRVQAFPRSRSAAYLLFGAAAAWFLYKVLHLGPADFGVYRHILFIVFLTVAVGSFYFVPDFLAVRGLAGLLLLVASALLEAAFMEPPTLRLFLVSFVYLVIAVALVLGASPYKLRDFLDWLYRSNLRPRILGGLFTGYGLLLIGVAFAY
ncbi:MAG: hypothetical protein ACLFUF_06510 [Opitutales bacterium]